MSALATAGAPLGQQLGEQAQLGGAIGASAAVVVQMVARQVGERRGGQPHAVQPELVQPVRGRLHRRVRDAGARQAGEVSARLTGSGVVRPGPGSKPGRDHARACPRLAAGMPPAAQIWRRNSTVLVLPLVPVTATTVVGLRPGQHRGDLRQAAARLGVRDQRARRHARRPDGARRRQHRDRAARHRIGDEGAAVGAAARQRGEQVARAPPGGCRR